MWGLGFAGLGFGVWGLGFGVWGFGFRVWVFSVFDALCNLHDPFHDVRSAIAAHNIHTAAGARRHDAPRKFSRANVVGGADVGEADKM